MFKKIKIKKASFPSIILFIVMLVFLIPMLTLLETVCFMWVMGTVALALYVRMWIPYRKHL